MSETAINTQVCTFQGCCVPNPSDTSEKSAWSEAASWWFCQRKNFCRNFLCGTFCLPCQFGVLAGNTSCCKFCPTDSTGILYCTGFAFFADCCPPIALWIESDVIDRVNNTDHAKTCAPFDSCKIDGDGCFSACMWAILPLCTCAHCIIAEKASLKDNSTTSAHYARF